MKFEISRMNSFLQWLRRTVGANSLVIYFLLFILLFSSNINDDYQTGLDAYAIGDYQTAMKKWLVVAEGPATATNPAVYMETHYAIAMLYWQGQGVPRDFYQAREWLLKAANLNHAGAQAKLGSLYTDGISVRQDFDQAFEWYSKAARQGDIDGQYNLGIFYLNGWGTEQDTTMAKMYLAAASTQGDEAAEDALQSLLASGDAGVGHARESFPTANTINIEENRERSPLLSDETWILSQNPNHYTIQAIGLSSTEKLKALINGHDNLAPFAIYTVQRSSNPIHVLIQGSYTDVDAARTARDTFPSGISRPDKVWIRQFGKIQELIAAERIGDG